MYVYVCTCMYGYVCTCMCTYVCVCMSRMRKLRTNLFHKRYWLHSNACYMRAIVVTSTFVLAPVKLSLNVCCCKENDVGLTAFVTFDC